MHNMDSTDIDLLNIGLILNEEKNLTQILTMMLQLGNNFTHSDASCIYLIEDSMLHYTMLHIQSKKLTLSNLVRSEIPLFPHHLTTSNVITQCINTKQIITINDVYHCKEYNTDVFQTFDRKLHYHTYNTLLLPLFTNQNEMLGVLQFMNCTDAKKGIIPYAKDIEMSSFYFATQATMAISNNQYMQATKDLLYSFAEVMAAAIDERTPYNANHSRNVSNYILDFVKYYNEQYKLGYVEEYFDEVRLEQLHLAALLHDIGKVAIPLDVMNKSTRLGKKLKDILSRFELFRCYYKIDFLEHKLRQEEYDALVTQLNQIQEFILRINSATYLNDTDYNTLQQYKHLAYCVKNRKKLPYLTPEEFECLSIRTGTLTAKEREIMESHVVITERLLKRFKFQKQYANIPRWANSHHEFLDGSGYPKHLTGKDMPLEIRILCIADIYDALTATDRPYKSPMSQEKALSILYDMSEEGKLDRNLVLIFSDMLKDAQP